MSSFEDVEQVDILPDRLAAADFSAAEISTIKGKGSEEVRQAASAGFNWIAAYLCEEVGFHEDELTEWFRSEATGLDGETPLSVWSGRDGPINVFEYAQACKEMLDEDLVNVPDEHWRVRSHRLGNHALDIARRGFLAAGVDTESIGSEITDMTSYAIYNPQKGHSLTSRWKSNGQMEDWRISLEEGPRRATYFIVRYFPPDSAPFIMQTGIGRTLKTDTIDSPLDLDTDIDGRPPSIGEVASFVMPLANEVKNRSLALMS